MPSICVDRPAQYRRRPALRNLARIRLEAGAGTGCWRRGAEFVVPAVFQYDRIKL
jgi:hypothetical protein